jgi:putative transposase
LGISSRTYQRWTKDGKIKEDQRAHVKRKPPKNKLTDKEKQRILAVCNSKEYAGDTPHTIVPKLMDDKGIYVASESSFYRVLREYKQLTHRRISKAPEKRPITTHIAINPNEVWSWDITWLNTTVKGRYFKLYMILDIFSRKIVGFEVWHNETSEHAKTLVKKALLKEKVKGKPLVLHSDNGAPMKGATFLATLEKLGVQSSFSRPRVSNDNAFSESLFKTMKYAPVYPKKGFDTLEEARIWVIQFVHWYNKEHYHSGVNYVTPHDRHEGRDKSILDKRNQIIEEAKLNNPERWSRHSKTYQFQESVALNPTKEIEHQLAIGG